MTKTHGMTEPSEGADRPRRVVTYERVSSDTQREKATILTQNDELLQRLNREPGAEIVGRYTDDGISGAIEFRHRAAGYRLLQDARRRVFDEVWVYKLDRVGRDDVDPIIVRRELAKHGVRLVALHENLENELEYSIRVAFAAEERRVIKRRTSDGLNRAAREGRYTGGIVPFGYRVEGEKQNARYVVDEALTSGAWSAAEVIRWVYHRLGLDGWSCRRIADDLNRRGVLTSYVRARRGVRGKATRGVWRAGRIRNMVVEPMYKGRRHFGNRSKAKREVTWAEVPAIVSPELWQAAQDALARNRIMAKNTTRTYLLRSLLRCGLCGLHYCGAAGVPGVWWYRCDGYLQERGPAEGRCKAKSIKGDWLEPVVLDDIEQFLRNPRDLLQELEMEVEDAAAVDESELVTLRGRLVTLDAERARAIDLHVRGLISPEEIDVQLSRITKNHADIEERLAEIEDATLASPVAERAEFTPELLLTRWGQLSDQERAEVARHLVRRITVNTEVTGPRRTDKRATIVIEYSFPNPNLCVVPTSTGRGSSPLSARSSPGRSPTCGHG